MSHSQWHKTTTTLRCSQTLQLRSSDRQSTRGDVLSLLSFSKHTPGVGQHLDDLSESVNWSTCTRPLRVASSRGSVPRVSVPRGPGGSPLSFSLESDTAPLLPYSIGRNSQNPPRARWGLKDRISPWEKCHRLGGRILKLPQEGAGLMWTPLLTRYAAKSQANPLLCVLLPGLVWGQAQPLHRPSPSATGVLPPSSAWSRGEVEERVSYTHPSRPTGSQQVAEVHLHSTWPHLCAEATSICWRAARVAYHLIAIVRLALALFLKAFRSPTLLTPVLSLSLLTYNLLLGAPTNLRMQDSPAIPPPVKLKTNSP